MMQPFSLILQPSSYNLHDAAILPFSAAFFLQPSRCSHSPFFCSLLPTTFTMQPFSLFLQPSSYNLHDAAIVSFYLVMQPSFSSLHDAAILPFSIMFGSLLPKTFMMQPFSPFISCSAAVFPNS
jgi:hypothetical protein